MAGAGWPGILGAALRWPALMLAPGAAVYLIAARLAPRLSGLALWSLVLSPVITAVAGIAGLSLHLPPATVADVFAAVSLAGCAVGFIVTRTKVALPDRRSLLWLGALLGVVVLLTAFLPMTRSWWRIRSDAWFHAAVVAQISDYGIPPEDPYFAGMPLQYMWFYHVLVLVLSRATDLDPFRVMALINIHGVLGLGIGAWQLCGVFRRTLAHRFAATMMLLLGFNAAFWLFLPAKLVRALRGDVRGLDEIKRTFSLVPFDYDHARDFMNVYYNWEFFLDKFMVATAFGLSLVFMVAGWYAAAEYLRTRRPESLLLLGGALVGMLGFHSLVGFVMLVGIFGGGILAWLLRDRTAPFPLGCVAVMLGVSLASFLAMTPYLYELMQVKERSQLFPLSVSLQKTVGILISCSFALTLFLIRRPLLRERSLSSRFFLLGAMSLAVFCLVITLPGSNAYDKLGIFIFLPLSILGGIALADLWLERSGPARRRLLAWTVACILPTNALPLAAAFATPDRVEVTPAEARLSAWLREHTPREALIVDDNDRVVFLVTVPRRYLWGSWAYAQQWGYPRLEMARRLHMRRALYTSGNPDASALDVLGEVQVPLYVVVRPEHRAAGSAVVQNALLFQPVYEDSSLALYRVDTSACRSAASRAFRGPSQDEILRASGF